jgi:hypothetical protein
LIEVHPSLPDAIRCPDHSGAWDCRTAG